jgi:hypothetical protein
MGATVLIASRRFSLFPSHFSLPSPFTAPWLTPLLVPLLLSLLHQPTPMTRGTTPGWKAPRWPPRLLQLVTLQKWRGGNLRTHRLLQEDDCDRRRPPSVPRPWIIDR